VRVAIFLDHDIICRNFVISGGFAELSARHEVTYVFPDDALRRVTIDPGTLPLGGNHTRLATDPKRQQTWRWMLFADQLRLRPGSHEAAVRRLRRRTLGWKASVLLTLAGFPVLSTFFEKFARARLAARPNVAMTDFLRSGKFDVVVHPSVLEGVFINDLVAACRETGIPLVVAMNSWDNPSTKRAVVGMPDRILVWGPQTREHTVRFIGMRPENVTCFGAPQFDVFRNPPRYGRDAFRARLGVESGKFLILVAGANTQTDEVATLEMIDRAIDAGRLGNAAVVYRPHPWGGGGKGGTRLADLRLRNVVFDPTMLDYIAAIAAGNSGISLPDSRDSHELLSHVDAVVSPMSTMLLEATMHGKPIIAFSPDDKLAGGSNYQSLPMLYFDTFLALPDIRLARTGAELLTEMEALMKPGVAVARGAALAAATAGFVTPFDRPWASRIVDYLVELSASRRPAN